MQLCEKFGQNPLEFFSGNISYQMKLKPRNSKGFIEFIKALFNPEYELIPINGWNSDKGEAMKIFMRSYHQLNAEEEKRISDQMNKK
jgi:hypothetical protein